MFGKSAKEVVLWVLLLICFAFVAGLLLLCVWGMYSRSFVRFLNYAIAVSTIGTILLALCVDALASAETERKYAQIHDKRNVERMMYYESKAIINKDGEIIIEMASDDELMKLRKENEALKLAVQNTCHTVREMEKQRAAEREGYRNQYNTLLNKYERSQDDFKQYQQLFYAARDKNKADEKEWRGRLEISHLDHMELRAWRKTEKARKQRDDKLRSRVLKIRKRKKVSSLIVAAGDLAVASKTERECNIPAHRLEISNDIIALAEYLKPYHPNEELQTYLWDCRTVEILLDDIRTAIVKTAFGVDWESRILSGLVGLNIITAAVFTSIVANTTKPRKKGREKNKRPAQ